MEAVRDHGWGVAWKVDRNMRLVGQILLVVRFVAHGIGTSCLWVFE